MLLTAFFSDKGVPKLGLTPTIDVWEDDTTHVVNAQNMVEIAGGWYKYDFAGYDESKDYVIRADGGAGLADNDRYCFASNEVGQVTEDLTDVKGTGFVKDTDSLVDIRPETDKIQTEIIAKPGDFMADVTLLALEATAQLIKTETDKIQTGIIDVPNTYKANVAGLALANEYDVELAAIQADLDNPDQYKADVSALALEATAQLIKTETDKIAAVKTETDKIQPDIIAVPGDYKADVSALALEATSQLIKTEVDKIQPDIIAVPNTYKADVSALALEATAQLIKTETDKIQTGIIDVPENYMADVSGLGVTGEYDAVLAAIQADLDNPNQYKADVAALALEATSQLIKTETDKIQPDIIGSPGDYKADVATLALEATAQLIKTEVDKIQPDIIAVPGNYKADVTNLDVAVSTRSSHTAANVWAVGVRTLTSFGTLVADIWAHAARTLTSFGTLVTDIWATVARTLTAGTRDAEIDAIKLETDKIQPDIIGVPGNYKADISTLALEDGGRLQATESNVVLIKTETDKIVYILGLVQENFRLKNQVYDVDRNLTAATIRIYASAAACDADVGAIAEYTMTATYDVNGNCNSYKVTKV